MGIYLAFLALPVGSTAKLFGIVAIVFVVAMVVLALGYQLHFSVNSAAFYLRFARPNELQWLMPVFWVGFNIAMFPASVVVKHRGGLLVMGAGRPVRRGCGHCRGTGRRSLDACYRPIRRGLRLGLHADECGLGGARNRKDRCGGQGNGARVFSHSRLPHLRGWRRSRGVRKPPGYAALLKWAAVAC